MSYQHAWHLESTDLQCVHACVRFDLSLVFYPQISCYSWSLYLKAQGNLHGEIPTVVAPLAYMQDYLLCYSLMW